MWEAMKANAKQMPKPSVEARKARAVAEALKAQAWRDYVRATRLRKETEEILRRNNIAASIIGGKQA